MTGRADWLGREEARWGVFIHFLAIPPGSYAGKSPSADEWNARVDAFDVDGLARQLAAAGARYCFLTLGQCSGHFCAPNATYEAITGSGKCSRRDLVADLHAALAGYGIRLLVYLPSHAPVQDPDATRRLRFVPPDDFALWSPLKGGFSPGDSDGIDRRVTAGQRNWEAIIREWSLRWGERIGGWWFDGCYYAETFYRHPDAPNFASFAAAARAGNPGSIVAWNPGILYPPAEVDIEEDYTAGEVNDPWKLHHGGKWRGRERYHVLTFLGQGWGLGPVRFTAREAALFIQEVNSYGGAMTWDLPINYNGLVQPDTFEVLSGIEGVLAAAQSPASTVSITIALERGPSRNLSGTEKAGICSVELSNLSDLEISGHLALDSHPPGMLKIGTEAALGYRLQPGEKKSRSIPFTFSESHPFGFPVEMTVPRGEGLPPSRIDVSASYELRTPVPPLSFIADGQVHGTMALGREGGDLVLDLTVEEAELRISEETPWTGSCVEMFIAEKAGAKIWQYFLIPDPSGGGRVIRQSYFREELPAGSYKMKMTDEGYTGLARLPLHWLLGEKGKLEPDSVLVAFCLNMINRKGTFVRARLFGAENILEGTFVYAVLH